MDLQNILDEKLEKSRFAHIFTKEGKIQLFHSILMNPLYLDEESFGVYNAASCGRSIREILQENPGSNDLLKTLVEGKFLIKKGSNESEAFRKWVQPYNYEGLSIMYLLPTDECNFRCKYCFLENSINEGEYHYSYMNSDTMKKGIDFFIQKANPKMNPTMIIYGGEPLLNPEITRGAVEYVRKNYPHVKVNLVTNGSLVTKELAKFFSEEEVSVGVSIDGPEEVHNQARIFKNSFGTYDSAVRGYNFLKEAGCKHLGISLTIGSHNVHNLKSNVEKVFKDLSPNAFGFNFLIDTSFGTNPYTVPMEYATEQSIKAFEFLRGIGIFEERMMRKIKPFIQGIIHLKDCGAPGNQIVLAPNGDIGPCQAFLPSRKYFDQNIDKNPCLECNSFSEWKQRYPININECLDCEAIGICGGGCPYQSYLSTGSIFGLDKRMCTHNKQFLDWLLWDLFDSQDGKSKS